MTAAVACPVVIQVTVPPVDPAPIIQAVREALAAPAPSRVSDSQRWIGRWVPGFHDY